jgi:hypothetical protein
MAAHAKSESESVECYFEMSRIIDQKRYVRHLLFLTEFARKQQRELRRSRLKEPNMEELVCVGIDGGVQPVALAIDANHRLVNRDLIRLDIAIGL